MPWSLLRATIIGFIEDEAMSRGAAIAYYTVFSIAPLLVIATAIAGTFLGRDAAAGAIASQLQGLMDAGPAATVDAMVRSAGDPASGGLATLLGLGTLLLTASGAFSEVQAALNRIWRVPAPERDTLRHLLRDKALAVALVLGTGILLLASLLASAALSVIGTFFAPVFPNLLLLSLGNGLLSFAMVAALFAALYKILPNRPIGWRDVAVGAVVTALLFNLGKWLIGLYIGGSHILTTYGAAGALMALLVWIYYSAQVFLLGAEFTRVWSERRAKAALTQAAATTRSTASA